jgi:hypothetical protein
MSCYLLDSPDRPDLAPYLAIADEFCALPLLHEDQALEWSYLDGETDVVPSRLKSAAELLVLRHDTLKLIDGAGPEALAPSQYKAEEPSANGKEPEQQTVPENERAKTSQQRETAKEQEHTSKTANCTFSGELVSIDLKRFTDSGISLVECPRLLKNAFALPGQGRPPVQTAHPAQAADASSRETLVGHRKNRLGRGWRGMMPGREQARERSPD